MKHTQVVFCGAVFQLYTIEQVGNELKNTAMAECMRALCILIPLEAHAVELGDVTLSYGDKHNLPMIKWSENGMKLCQKNCARL